MVTVCVFNCSYLLRTKKSPYLETGSSHVDEREHVSLRGEREERFSQVTEKYDLGRSQKYFSEISDGQLLKLCD